MQVRLGNKAAIARPDGLSTDSGSAPPATELKGKRVTYVQFPEGTTLIEAFTAITAPGGVWAQHSAAPPTWVDSDNKQLAELIVAQYGCECGAPADLEKTHHTDAGPPGVGPKGPIGGRS